MGLKEIYEFLEASEDGKKLLETEKRSREQTEQRGKTGDHPRSPTVP